MELLTKIDSEASKVISPPPKLLAVKLSIFEPEESSILGAVNVISPESPCDIAASWS